MIRVALEIIGYYLLFGGIAYCIISYFDKENE